MKDKPVEIRLSLVQIDQMHTLIKRAIKAKKRGQPGAILAQVYPDQGFMRVSFLSEEACMELQPIFIKYKNLEVTNGKEAKD